MRKYSKRKRKKANNNKSFFTIGVVVCVLLAYSLYASSAGKWIMQNYIKPVFNEEEPVPAKEEKPEQSNKKQQNMSYGGMTVYAMQTGAYKQEENAKAAAEKITNGGNAAYIHKDGLYRVLVFGSPSKEETNNAKKAMEAIAGINSNEYAIKIPDLNLKVTGDEKNLATIDTAFKTYISAMEKMSKLSLEADKKDANAENILNEKKEIKNSLSEIQKQLDPLSEKDDKVKKLNELYKDIISRLEKVEDGDKATVLSDIKSSYMEMACKYADFVKDVSKEQ